MGATTAAYKVMEGCPFCGIVAGDVGHVIWEDDAHVAFLSANPSTEGATMLVPRRHAGGYLFALADDELAAMLVAAKRVAELLDHYFAPQGKRTMMVARGFTVDHAHVKLYPITAEDKRPHGSGERSPKADDATLAALAAKLRAAKLRAARAGRAA